MSTSISRCRLMKLKCLSPSSGRKERAYRLIGPSYGIIVNCCIFWCGATSSSGISKVYSGQFGKFIKPVSTMVIYTVCLGYILRVSSEGIPYLHFLLFRVLALGILCSSHELGGRSVLAASNLVTKVYFPRILIPFGQCFATLVDLAIASVALLLLMIHYKICPTVNVLLVPVTVLVALVTALGTGLFLLL